MAYSPQLFEPLTFFDITPRFRDGRDTPRAYLERCLAVIADREPVVKAWVALTPREHVRRPTPPPSATCAAFRSRQSTACR